MTGPLLPRRLTAVTAALVLVGGAVVAGTVTSSSAATVAPQLKIGNQTCSQVMGPGFTEYKLEPVTSGTFGNGQLSVAVTVNSGTKTFDFTASGGTVYGVAVKGGPNLNFYDYRPSAGTSGDTGLHAPNSGPSSYYGLSHISFCYKPATTLTVQKFIDVDQSGGTAPNAGDVSTQAADTHGDLDGWVFLVKNSSSATVCTLTTNAAGKASCSLPNGTYSVEEHPEGGPIGTGPSASYRSTPEPVNVTLSGSPTTVNFGNACRIAKPFEVTGVPAGTSAVHVKWTMTTDVKGVSANGTLSLTDAGSGKWTGTTGQIFDLGDVLSWEYGPSLNDLKAAGTHAFVAVDGYPTCRAGVNTVAYAPGSISGKKYKDTDGDGVVDPADIASPLEGWEFRVTGPSHPSGTLVYSDAAGSISLTGLAAGSYSVQETGNVKVGGNVVVATNWERTAPATDTQNVTITLNDGAKTINPFLNAPLSNLKVGFTDLTGSTDVAIVCKDAAGNTIPVTNSSTNGQSLEDFTDTLAGIRLSQSKVTCEFTITDP